MSKMKTKIKQFVADHPAEIFATVVTGAAIGVYALALKNANHASKKAIEAYNEYADLANAALAKAEADGKAVFLLSDWTYLLVPKDTPTEWIQDITKL